LTHNPELTEHDPLETAAELQRSSVLATTPVTIREQPAPTGAIKDLSASWSTNGSSNDVFEHGLWT